MQDLKTALKRSSLHQLLLDKHLLLKYFLTLLKILFVRSRNHIPTGLGEKHFVLPNDSFDKITLKKP